MNQSLRRKQLTVALGAASGGLGAFALVALLYRYAVPDPGLGPDLAPRLVYALRCVAVAALTVVAGIGAIANGRFASDAIDPTAHAESPRMVVLGRYLENTLQQYVIFLVGTLSAATYLEPAELRLLPAMAVTFLVGRVVFWVGYLKGPLYRAPGMAATMYPNFILLFWVVYRVLRQVVAGG